MMEGLCPGNRSIPALSDEVILATQVTASITCILSICGASLIIFTYVAFKDLRTTARQLLVSLSVADAIIALSSFIGLLANYERFVSEDDKGIKTASNSSNTDVQCIIQAAFTMFGTVASLLFSILIALYLFALTHCESMKSVKRLLPFIYITSWGIPLIIVISVAAVESFGFEPLSDPGWCYTMNRYKINTFSGVLAHILSYELWAYLCFLLLMFLYASLFCSSYLKCKACRKHSGHLWHGPAKGDAKLLFIPPIFFALRIWMFIIDAGFHYTSSEQKINFKCSSAAAL